MLAISATRGCRAMWGDHRNRGARAGTAIGRLACGAVPHFTEGDDRARRGQTQHVKVPGGDLNLLPFPKGNLGLTGE